jgi:hypothetical protein
MMPSREEAEQILCEAENLNPGPWVNHSRVAAACAEKIAGLCPGMDPDKAYVLGLLHDIGRRFGKGHLRHVYDGYNFMLRSGYEEAARVCLTHSFCVPDIHDYIGNFDITVDEQKEITDCLQCMDFNDYDYLIQLCDSLAMPGGAVDMEIRMADVERRYGYYPAEKRNRNKELKAYFEKLAGKNIYEIICDDRRLWGK